MLDHLKLPSGVSKWPLNDLRFDGFDYTGALDGMKLVVQPLGKTWQNATGCYAPPFLMDTTFRKETSPDVPAWYVGVLKTAWKRSVGGERKFTVLKQMVLRMMDLALVGFFISSPLRQWFCWVFLLRDKIWEIAPPVHANQPTSEKPQVFPRFSTWTLSRLRLRRCKKLGSTSVTNQYKSTVTVFNSFWEFTTRESSPPKKTHWHFSGCPTLVILETS